jgi:cell division protein FtsN
MTRTVKRKKRRTRSGGGTLLGLMLGLVLGLAVAVAAALYTTRASVPFVDKVKRPAPTVDPTAQGEVPDPNRSMQKGRVTPTDTVASGTPATPAPTPGATVPGTATPSQAVVSPVSPATPAPAAVTEPAAEQRATYLLQAGAYRGQEDAEGMKVRLALIGFEAGIGTAEVNGVTFYRVRVGPYRQIEDMNRARSRLAENGIEASVVRQR